MSGAGSIGCPKVIRSTVSRSGTTLCSAVACWWLPARRDASATEPAGTLQRRNPQERFRVGAARLDGRVLDETDTWGKYLFHRYGDLWLHVHLGLFGRYRDGRGIRSEPGGAVRLLLAGQDAWAELRGPVACEVMNQAVIAGVGNVYRAEALWRSGTSPFVAGRDVEPSVVRTFWDDLAVLMRAGVRSGRIVTTDALDRERPAGRPRRGDAHDVYRRTDRPCRWCGTPVQSA